MGRPPDATARQLWSDRLRRFRDSGLTAAAFRAREGVSLASFYAWRRRLRDLARIAGTGAVQD